MYSEDYRLLPEDWRMMMVYNHEEFVEFVVLIAVEHLMVSYSLLYSVVLVEMHDYYYYPWFVSTNVLLPY